MLKLRKCSNGKWVFDHGDYVEFINSNRHSKVYQCERGRYIKELVTKTRVYIEYFKEVEA